MYYIYLLLYSIICLKPSFLSVILNDPQNQLAEKDVRVATNTAINTRVLNLNLNLINVVRVIRVVVQ